MNGVTEQMMQQVSPEQAQDPKTVEMAMGQAAQQVMQANQQPQQPTPEQQLVGLEQEKVKLQQQKLQSDTAVQAAEMELKNKKLELEENEQILDILKAGATDKFKKEKAEADREAKKELKIMDILAKVGIEEEKLSAEGRKTIDKLLKDLNREKQLDQRDKEMIALQTLSKMAVEGQKELDSENRKKGED